MSSGSNIPYHLRQNKAVERVLFEEQLKILGSWLLDVSNKSIEEYRYVGFGGPFLEDFKSIHRNLNIKNMLSIEYDENTLMRQRFNKPISCINLPDEPLDSSEFITKDQFQIETILWLDYVNTDYNSQLNDIKNAVEKMNEFDILKMTFNANVSNIKSEKENLHEGRLEEFSKLISDDYRPSKMDPDSFTAKRFHNVLIKEIQNALSLGVRHKKDVEFVILSAFVYKDGQKMLTVCCILLTTKSKAKFEEKAKLKDWEFYFHDDKVYDISLPSLSARERIEIERLLPNGGIEEVKNHLGYNISHTASESNSLLENFINYHSRYPWFGKISM